MIDCPPDTTATAAIRRHPARLQARKQMRWHVAVLTAFGLHFGIPYLEGRCNAWWFPFDLLPVIAVLAGCVALAAFWVRAWEARSIGLVQSTAFLAACTLFYLLWVPPRPADLFADGFRDYARHVLTAQEWREISRVAQERLGPDGRLPGPGKDSLWQEKEHRALWSALAAATQIGKLPDTLVIRVGPGGTDVSWGGELAGHRAVTISTGRVLPSKAGSLDRQWFVAEDISTSVSSN